MQFSLSLSLSLVVSAQAADITIAAPVCNGVDVTNECITYTDMSGLPNELFYELTFSGFGSYADTNTLYTRLVSSPGASGWNELLEFVVYSQGPTLATTIGGRVCINGDTDSNVGCSDSGGYDNYSPLPQDGTVDDGSNQLVGSFPLDSYVADN